MTPRSTTTGGVRRRTALGLLGGAAALGLARPARAADRVGQVGAVIGPGFAEQEVPRPLQEGGAVEMGDRVWTEAEARATLSLDLGALIHMGPATELTLDAFTSALQGIMTLGEGAIVLDRPEDLPPADIEIQTEFGSIGVRGTRFFAGPSRGVFGVFAERGRVAVMAGGAEVLLGAGEGVGIPPEGPMTKVTRWPADRIAEAMASVLP